MTTVSNCIEGSGHCLEIIKMNLFSFGSKQGVLLETKPTEYSFYAIMDWAAEIAYIIYLF